MVIAVQPNVIVCDLSDGAALLDVASGVYFNLNDVGFFIWSVIESGTTTFDKLRDAILAEFDVDQEAASQDLSELLQELKRNGLITMEGVDVEILHSSSASKFGHYL